MITDGECVACDNCLPGPVALPCGHAYCRACFRALLRARCSSGLALRCCPDPQGSIPADIAEPFLTHLSANRPEDVDCSALPSGGRADMRSLDFCGQQLWIREDTREGIGGRLWTCSLILAAYLEWVAAHGTTGLFPTSSVKGQWVVELGSGCGVAGLAASMLGAYVTFTDLPEVLPILSTNVCDNLQRLGRDAATYRVVAHAWGTPPYPPPPAGFTRALDSDGREKAESATPALVLLADVLYDTAAVAPLWTSLSALAGRNTVACLTHVNRYNSALSDFLGLCAQHNVAVRRVSAEIVEWCSQRLGLPISDTENDGIFVLQFGDLCCVSHQNT